jgi:benzoyl-CoA reductase subunit C
LLKGLKEGSIEMLEKFREVTQNRHQYAQEWKARTGGRVLGYFCTYVPEELIYAAGVLPVRITGSHEPQDVTEPHIYTMFCPFCRDCLAQGLQGRYQYLDGVVGGHSCMHIRNAFSSWVLNIPTSFNHYVLTPTKVQSPWARDYLVGELELFKKSLEEWTGRAITEADLDRAIEVFNTNRRLLRQLYELRLSDPPKLAGVEAAGIVLSSMYMDKAEHNQWLEAVLEEVSQRPHRPKPGARLMIISSIIDNIEFFELVEDTLGAHIVIDDICNGTRYFWNEVTPQRDRLAAIATRYLDRPPCPVKDFEQRRRWPHILGLAKEYGVQGALLVQQKFCDPHEFDIPSLMELFEENHIPSLFLEFDITVPTGQYRTRVEAFLEMLEFELV